MARADEVSPTSEADRDASGRPVRLPARRLLALARPESRTLLIAVACLVVGSAAELLFPRELQRIIDGALLGTGVGAVDGAALRLLALFGLQSVAVALRYYFFNLAGERVVARLREQLYRSIIAQEIAFFDQRRIGELTNRLSSDTTVLQNTVSINLSMLLRNLASVVGGIALLFWTSPPLTLVMLAIIPPVSVGAVLVGRRLRKLSREVQDALAGASAVAEETLGGLRTVRAFTQEEGESKRYADAIWRAFGLARRRSQASSLFAATAAFAGYGAVAAVIWYGGRLVVGGELSVGQLSSFVVYTLIVAFSLASLSELWADLMRASGAAERVFELIDRSPNIPMRGGAQPAHNEASVTLEEVRFVYPARPDVEVLKGISLSIAPGEVVALVGPSGSGKSTIAALLTRLYDPVAGQLRFGGHELASLDPGWLRKQIGVVSQEPTLFSTSIAQNIRYGREEATDEEVYAAARAANAYDFIQKFPDGFATQVGERGVQLSGGQKQRIAIARALLRDPKLLILDEATSALDAESEHLVKEALDRLMKGRTTLIIAHRLSTVRDANRVIVLSEGRIAQQGSHDELLKEEGIYKRLVSRQLGE